MVKSLLSRMTKFWLGHFFFFLIIDQKDRINRFAGGTFCHNLLGRKIFTEKNVGQNNEFPRSSVAMVRLLLNLKKIYISFLCFHCWLWTSKWRLRVHLFVWIINLSRCYGVLRYYEYRDIKTRYQYLLGRYFSLSTFIKIIK